MAKPTMLDYVVETPAILQAQLHNDPAAPLAEAFLARPRRIVRIVACGSSRNAAVLARPYLRRVLGREVLVSEPHTFCSYEHELPDDEFCFVISQSGYSTNALDALACMRAAGTVAIGVTGDATSDFSAAADLLIDYGVGVEQVGYVTKGVTSLAMFLALFGLDVAEHERRLDGEARARELEAYTRVIDGFEAAHAQTPQALARRYQELSSMDCVFICGAGPNYGIAREGALKYAECLQIPAQGLELEEFLHGPNLQIDPTYTLMFVSMGEASWARTRQIVAASKLVSSRVFHITDDPDASDADVHLPGGMPELLAPMAALPFFQMTAYQLTEDKHLWHKHPLVARFDAMLSGKSENYVDKEVL